VQLKGLGKNTPAESPRKKQGAHYFTGKKNPGLFQDPTKNFLGPFRNLRMSKYKEKTAFTHNIQSVAHCGKFSMKQNVDVSCSVSTSQHKLGAIPLLLVFHLNHWKMHDFQGHFPGLSGTSSFNFRDFPGPKWFSRTFQVLEFSRKKSMTFQEGWERYWQSYETARCSPWLFRMRNVPRTLPGNMSCLSASRRSTANHQL